MKPIKLADLVKHLDENYLDETLTFTHAIEPTINYLNFHMENENDTYFKKYDNENRFYLFIRNGILSERDAKWIIMSTLDARGWKPTYLTISGYKLPYKSFEQFLAQLNKNRDVTLTFDAKFDLEVGESVFPEDYAYHVTVLRRKEKILKIGLVPKSKDKISSTYPRVYLTFNMDGINLLLGDSRFTQNEKEFVIFKIDMKSLFKTKKLRFFEDSAFISYGCYTNGNIPSQYIKVEKEIKL